MVPVDVSIDPAPVTVSVPVAVELDPIEVAPAATIPPLRTVRLASPALADDERPGDRDRAGVHERCAGRAVILGERELESRAC